MKFVFLVVLALSGFVPAYCTPDTEMELLSLVDSICDAAPDSERRGVLLEELDSMASCGADSLDVAAAFSFVLSGDSAMAVSVFEKAMDRIDSNGILFGRISDFLIDYYDRCPAGTDRYRHYLEMRIAYGRRTGQPSAAIFLALGKLYLSSGDFDRASVNLDSAYLGREALSPAELAGLAGAYRELKAVCDADSGGWWTWTVVILALSVAAVSIVFNLRRHRKQPPESEVKASVENGGRQAYANAPKAMLSLALLSVDKNREFCLLVERKLAAGQSKDLFNMVSSGRYTSKLNDEFFSSFDENFRIAYPDFFIRLNSLLLPEKAFVENEDGRLTPEMRIAAFLGLGISGSSDLSRLLGLSLNTVYTYRNRLKGRAADRVSFEKDIRNIIA